MHLWLRCSELRLLLCHLLKLLLRLLLGDLSLSLHLPRCERLQLLMSLRLLGDRTHLQRTRSISGYQSCRNRLLGLCDVMLSGALQNDALRWRLVPHS